MRWFSFLVILFITTLLEAGNLLNVFVIGGWAIRPSILITLLVYYAFSSRTRGAIIYAFLIGFAVDLTGRLMGPHMICFGLLGLLLNQANQTLPAKRTVYRVLIVFTVYCVAETFSYWLELFRGFDAKDSYYSILLFTGLSSAAISPVIWSLLSILTGRFTAKHTRSERGYL